VYPSVNLPSDFHRAFEGGVGLQETEIAFPDSALVLGWFHQISKNQPTRIGGETVPPSDLGLGVA